MLKHVVSGHEELGYQVCERCGLAIHVSGKFREGAVIVQHGPQMRCWTDLRLYEITGTPLSQAQNCR